MTDERLVHLVRRFKAAYAGDGVGRCFTFNYTSFSRWLDWGAVTLGFASGHFKTHSLRRGGAAHLSLQGFQLQAVMHFGRWTSEASARLYITKGEVALTRMKHGISNEHWSRILELAHSADQILFACAPGGR